jgi:hypothetical protein
MPNVIQLSVVMLNVALLNVIMLNAVMLNVVAPFFEQKIFFQFSTETLKEKSFFLEFQQFEFSAP